MGGLTTADMPYNFEGAVDLRDLIQDAVASILSANKKINPKIMADYKAQCARAQPRFVGSQSPRGSVRTATALS